MDTIFELSKKYNFLTIADEIQCGVGRCGKLKTCEQIFNHKPDMLVLGKSISGGFYPVSCVLGKNECMDVLDPGSHGSTYGGNSLATRLCTVSLDVLKNEGMIENSAKLGSLLVTQLKEKLKHPMIVDVRGKGLFTAVEILKDSKQTAWDICISLAKDWKILCKPTHFNIIRITPTLVINESDVN